MYERGPVLYGNPSTHGGKGTGRQPYRFKKERSELIANGLPTVTSPMPSCELVFLFLSSK